jgi:hypothetical protein
VIGHRDLLGSEQIGPEIASGVSIEHARQTIDLADCAAVSSAFIAFDVSIAAFER